MALLCAHLYPHGKKVEKLKIKKNKIVKNLKKAQYLLDLRLRAQLALDQD